MAAVSAPGPVKPNHTPDQQLAIDLVNDRLPKGWSKKTVMKDIDRHETTFYDEDGYPMAYTNEITKWWDPNSSITLLTPEQSEAAYVAKRTAEVLKEVERIETDEKLKQVLADRKNAKEPSHPWGLYLKKDTSSYKTGGYCQDRHYFFIQGFFSSEKVAKLAQEVLEAKREIRGIDHPVIAQDSPWKGRYFHVNGFTDPDWYKPIFSTMR